MSYQLDGEWELRHDTGLAYLIVEAGIAEDDEELDVNKFWVPYSVVEGMDMEDVGDVGTIEVADWWAEKNGLTED